ncbi:MAG TPA: AAA family ATPase [Archangium sp.]|uniref:trifunctional serine/threonine-protein kinase/ATP-binding protein/sensor histidine kinase n=1 Tax=Archangium sp. TaxID=1872627 RepID=UPI002E312669|nr:AAA family ATPase [Archangium sp.]HEX5754122.1 AAA family ATPase [Archangium sp.]
MRPPPGGSLPSPPPDSWPSSHRLYGRETHIAQLLRAFERVAQEGRSELLLVCGYSGIGKSSVVHALREPVAGKQGFFLSGKADQFQQHIPYATLAQAFHALARQLLAGPDEQLARWRERLRDALGEQGQLLVDVVPLLEQVLGRQPALPELPHGEAQHRFHRLVQRFLGVFAGSSRPLVLFLDDLQWIDLASLQLLQYLLTRPGTPPLLLAGAYRDNEVSPSHALALALTELREAGVRMSELRLEPLSREHVQQLVADSLPGAAESTVGPLSALVHEKTGGNPFFITRFLLTLHQDGLLTRTPEGEWRWDAAGVRARGYSGNVADFMVSRLRQLPVRTQLLLQLAACVGNVFPRQLLVIVSGAEPGEVEAGLEEVLREGMLVAQGPEQYRFAHDRIQQAAHALIPEREREAVHLRIGRLMLASLPPEQVHEKIFDVVGQLNAGVAQISDAGERHRLARLNAEAGGKARASTAFRSAVDHFTLAFSLIPGEPWETDPELAFKLQLDRAHGEFMGGNAAEARRLVLELLPRVRTRVQLAAVYRLRNDILLAANDIQGAITCLLECLARMGMHMSPHPSREEVEAANAEVWTLMGERPIERLVELPLMTDPDTRALMDVLAALFTPAIYSDPNLLALHLCRMVSLSLQHGNTEASVHGYGWYGLVLGSLFARYPEGHAFGLLACALAERHGFSSARGRALYALEMTSCWVRPLSRSLQYARDAFLHALHGGDFQIACYCSNHIVTDRLTLGHPLEEVYQESVARLHFARRAGFPAVEDVIHHVQCYVQQMRGLSRSFETLSSDTFDEASFEAGMASEHMGACWYWIIQLQSRFMSGDFARALEAGNRAAGLTWTSLGHIQLLSFHLYRALALAACHPSAPPEEQRRYLEEMRRHHRQLAEWAGHCPDTFRAPERMVSAELARLTGHLEEALQAYEEAIHSARAHGFLQNVALASELAARFWRERRAATVSDTYARQAREAYVKWGALGKVRQLEALWPQLVSFVAPSASPPEPGMRAQEDALSAVRALAGELDLGRLTAALVRVAVEHAEAQRGVVLLAREGVLSIAARSEPGEDALPWSLLAYVQRTGEHVLIADASLPHPFSSDVYFGRGGLRSVLCLPLGSPENLRGVLYLENRVSSQAFTPARLSLLGHLAAQAALFLESARRYAELQRSEASLRSANDALTQRVEEQTWRLEQAQARLADATREAGLGEMIASVLHNVGNVLTSALLNAQMLNEKVSTSRMVRLKQLTDLLETHREHLGEFLTREQQGAQLLEYLFSLSDELLREHASMKQSAGKLNEHLEHLRAILQVQQSYSRGSLLPEEFPLSQLVEDALSIQLPALQRHGITVTREFRAQPRARLDKHRVLQILINLLTNARNAMSEMPETRRRLLVRLDAEGSTARIQVVDSGKGIAPEHRERLFSLGFTTRADGQGLGLHSSALAAKSLGGRLTLESDGPGQGATATLELPLA